MVSDDAPGWVGFNKIKREISLDIGGHVLLVRPMRPDDVDRFVSYWHGGEADLAYLGIDPIKLGSPEDTRRRFLDMCRYGDRNASAVGFSFILDGRPVGFCNGNLRDRRAYIHIHIVDATARSEGLASAALTRAFPAIAAQAMSDYDLDELVLETRSRNSRINHLAEKLPIPVVGPVYLDDPDGLAGPGEFFIRRIPKVWITAINDVNS